MKAHSPPAVYSVLHLDLNEISQKRLHGKGGQGSFKLQSVAVVSEREAPTFLKAL